MAALRHMPSLRPLSCVRRVLNICQENQTAELHTSYRCEHIDVPLGIKSKRHRFLSSNKNTLPVYSLKTSSKRRTQALPVSTVASRQHYNSTRSLTCLYQITSACPFYTSNNFWGADSITHTLHPGTQSDTAVTSKLFPTQNPLVFVPARSMSAQSMDATSAPNKDVTSSVSSSSVGVESAASSVTDLKGAKVEERMTQDAREMFGQAVTAVLPSQMIRNSLQFDPKSSVLRVSEREFRVDHNVYVVGCGKAVLGMARALEDCLADHIVRGVISVPSGIVHALTQAGKQDMLLSPESRIQVLEGAKDNLPDEAAHSAAQDIQRLAGGLGEGDLLVVLISGGGSALLPAPIAPVTLEEMLEVTCRMSRSGASIVQLNAVRKQLEALKGGGLAEAAQPAQVLSLILSDVIGDPLDFIASGPTVPDQTTAEECLSLFSQFNIQNSVPKSVTELLSAKSKTQATSELMDWSRVHNVLVGTNKIACERVRETSEVLGYKSYVFSTELEGEARQVSQMFVFLAKYISVFLVDDLPLDDDRERVVSHLEESLLSNPSLNADKLKEMRKLCAQAKAEQRGVCLISGGETTVAVRGDGRGGRNQEMAVSVAVELHKSWSGAGADNSSIQETDGTISSLPTREEKWPRVVFLSAGTDGQDGPTPSAGAVVTPQFCSRATTCGVDTVEFLERNDSYNLLSAVDKGDNLVVTGLTGTNVMDVQLLLVVPGK